MTQQYVPWPKVVRHAQERIEQLRSALEQAATERVPHLQAEIRTWREVLALPETFAIPVIDDRAAY